MKTLRELLATVGLEDNSGGVSSIRLVMAAIVLQLVLTKVVLTIQTGQAQPWTQQDVYVLGVVLAAKSYQRGQEKPAAPEAPKAEG